MSLYPLFLKLEGRRCVVIGGGSVASRKVASLLKCGARVVVVSPEVCDEIARRAEDGTIELLPRPFQPDDLQGATLAVAATDHRTVNEAVYEAGKASGALVNVVDVPDLCDYYVPASFERGDLQVAICTGGSFPALAKQVRLSLEERFGPEYTAYVQLLARFRAEVKERIEGSHARAEVERAFLKLPILELVAQGNEAEAERLLRESLEKACGA